MKRFFKLSLIVFTAALLATQAFAADRSVPFAPGETLNPDCSPTDRNCSVDISVFENGLSITGAPEATTDALYNIGSVLYWNGARVINSGLSDGTSGQTLYYNGSSWVATSNIFIAGANIGVGTTNPGALLDLGSAGSVGGVLRLAGSTSGNVTVQPAVAAGTWTLTLPASGGTNNYFLQTNGNGLTTWAQAVTAETDPVVAAINGLVKSNGSAISTAVAGTDYSAGTAGLSTGIIKSTAISGALSTAAGSDINTAFGSQTQNYVYAAPNGSSGNPAFRALVAADIPTLNQNTTGSAATLTTARSIYGNSFNGSTDLAQVIASTYGGTGNGYTKFSGPATAEKTFTLPDATATILTTHDLVTVPQGGTGTATGSITGTGALTFAAGGSNQNVTLTPSGSGSNVLNGNTTISDLTVTSTIKTKGPWVDAKAFGAVGDGSTDDTAALQNALDHAKSLSDSNGGRNVRMYLSAGTYKITSQLVVNSNVDFDGEGWLKNYLADTYQPCVFFKAYSHASSLYIDANNGTGALFGDASSRASSTNIGKVKVINIGPGYDGTLGPQYGVKFVGYNYQFDDIETVGGNVAVDFSGASDIRGKSVIAVNSGTGMRMSGTEHINITNVDLDSSSYVGMQIDSSHDINISGSIWVNGTAYSVSPSYGMLLGEYTGGGSNVMTGLNLDMRLMNSGGTGIKLSNIRDSSLHVTMSNDVLFTSTSTPITTAIQYGSGVGSDVAISGIVDEAIGTFTSGTVAGQLNVRRGGAELIAGTGNVGIGTTIPGAKLQVSGGNILIDNNTFLKARNSTNNADKSLIGVNASDRVVIDNDALGTYIGGQVGIGTTAFAGYSLDVRGGNGTMHIQSTVPENYVQLYFQNSQQMMLGVDRSTGGGLLGGTSPYAGVIGTVSAYPLQFGTNDAVKMTLDSNGNLGIGTANPQKTLEINDADSNTATSGLRFTNFSCTGNDKLTVTAGGDVVCATDQTGSGTGNLVDNLADTLAAGNSANALDITNIGRLYTTLGATSTPAYTFQSDTDTGMWSSAANTLNLSAGGSERLRIDSSGNVGIGTTAPGTRLQLGDTSSSPGAVNGWSVFGGIQGYDLLGYIETNGVATLGSNNLTPLEFMTNNTGRVLIDTSGNVGIGTTAPLARLDVQGAGGLDVGTTIISSQRPDNLIPDPGFEYGGEHLSFDGTYTVPNNSTNAHSGNRYLQATGNGYIQDIWESEWIQVQPGDVYYGEVWVKADAPTNGENRPLFFEVVDKDFANADYDSFGDSSNPGTTWVKVSGTTTIPAGKYYMRIGHSVRDDSTTGNWYWDDAYVYKADKPGPLYVAGNVGIGTTNPSAKLTIMDANSDSTAPLGTNIVLDGTFDGDWSQWTKNGTDWTQSGGKAHHTTGNTTDLSQSISVEEDQIYQVDFTTSGMTTDCLEVKFSVADGDYWVCGNDTYNYSFVAKATGSDSLIFHSDSDWDGSIDDVTVKPLDGHTDSVVNILNSDGSDGLEIRSGGISNVALGVDAFMYNTTGRYNGAIGSDALHYNTSGSSNTAVGDVALYYNVSGFNNIAIGDSALYNNVSGYRNSAVGIDALYSNTTGYYNTALGSESLSGNIDASYNTAVGTFSLESNTSGGSNTAIGYAALDDNTTGRANTALGEEAGYHSTGDGNIFLGYEAGSNITSGDNNIVIGTGWDAPNATSSNQLAIGNDLVAMRYGSLLSPFDGWQFATPASGSALYLAVGDNDEGGIAITNDGTTVYGAADSNYLFRAVDEDVYGDTSGTVDQKLAAATRFTIDESGNVGIGTTSPNATLDVAGQIRSSAGGGLGAFYVSDYTDAGGPQYTGNWYAAHTWGLGTISDNIDSQTLRLGVTDGTTWQTDYDANLEIAGTMVAKNLAGANLVQSATNLGDTNAWELDDEETGDPVSPTVTQFVDGTDIKALESTSNGNDGNCYDWGYSEKLIKIDPNKKYEASIWMKQSVGTSGDKYFGFYFYDDAGNSIDGGAPDYIYDNPYFWHDGSDTDLTSWKQINGIFDPDYVTDDNNDGMSDHNTTKTVGRAWKMPSNAAYVSLRFGYCYSDTAGDKVQFAYPSIKELSPDDNGWGNLYVNNNTGSVGIGTIAPEAKLDVNGIIKGGGGGLLYAAATGVNQFDYSIGAMGFWGDGGGEVSEDVDNTAPYPDVITMTKTGTGSQWHSSWDNARSMTVTEGDVWHYSGWYKTSNDAGVDYLGILLDDDDWNSLSGYGSAAMTVDGEWHYFEGTIGITSTYTGNVHMLFMWDDSDSAGEVKLAGLKMYKEETFGSGLAGINVIESQTDSLLINPNGGRVGIGTTAPAAMLHVNNGTGSGSVDALWLSGGGPASDGTGPAIVFNSDYANFPTWRQAEIGSGWDESTDYAGYLSFRTNNSGNPETVAERMRIDKNGNVGIGTTDPGHKLTVQGSQSVGDVAFTGGGQDDMTLNEAELTGDAVDVRIQVDGTGSPNTFKWSIDGGSTWVDTGVEMTGSEQDLETYAGDSTVYVFITFDSTTGHTVGNYWDFAIDNSSDPFKVLDPNGSQLITANNDGYISFGQSDNAYFDRWGDLVALGVYADEIKAFSELGFDDSNGHYATFFKGGNQSKDLTYTWPNAYPGATTTLRSSSAGVLTWSSSSARFKDNIVNLSDDWSKILQTQPRSFTYKSDGSKDIGYIAEEFDALGLNDLVGYDTEGLPYNIEYDRITLYDTEMLKIHDREIGNINLGLSGAGLLDATSTSATSTQAFVENHPAFWETIRQILAKLGLTIQNGVASLKEVIADRFTAKEIQMIDKATGEKYCTWIQNGEWIKTKGSCDNAGQNINGQIAPVSKPASIAVPAVPNLPPSMISLTELEPQPEAVGVSAPTATSSTAILPSGGSALTPQPKSQSSEPAAADLQSGPAVSTP